MSDPEPDPETDADSLPNNRVVVVIVGFIVVVDVNLRTNGDVNEHITLTRMIAQCPYYACLLLTLSYKSTTQYR